MLGNLVRAGAKSYETSEVYRDLYDTFNFPPFQRLMEQMKDERFGDAMRMFVNVYAWVEEEYARLAPMERLGVFDAIMSNPETRSAVMRKFGEEKRAALHGSVTDVQSNPEDVRLLPEPPQGLDGGPHGARDGH